MSVVRNTELVRYREKQSVRLCDGFILAKLLDEDIRFRGIASTEDGTRVRIEKSNLVFLVSAPAKVRAVKIIDQGKNASAYGDSRRTRVARLFPRFAKGPNLLGLLHMKGLTRLVKF
jgi:hypothetical protein